MHVYRLTNSFALLESNFVKWLQVDIHTAIPRDMLPLDMLTPQIRHYEFRQKNSRYANFSNLSTPSYAIFDESKNSRCANFSAVFTLNYAIVNCVKKFRYTDFSPYYLTHREVACIFV